MRTSSPIRYHVMVDGVVIHGLPFHSRKAANKTAKRLVLKHGLNASVTTRKPSSDSKPV